MFCSNCGKTIRPEDDACRHCGAILGEGRFYGNTYTSSQVRLPVEALNEAPEGGMMSYTRTNYMSYDNQPEDDVYSNTTYRPLLSDEEDLALQEAEQARIEAEEAARLEEEEAAQAAEAEETAEAFPSEEELEAAFQASMNRVGKHSEEARAAEMAAEEAAEETAPEEEPAEDIPGDDFIESTSPLPELERPAITPRVLSYMEELENREQRRANSKLNNLRMPAFLNKLRKDQPAPEDELPEAEDIEGVIEEEAVYGDEQPAYVEDAEVAAEETYETDAEEIAEEAAEGTDAEAWDEAAEEGEYVAEEGEDSFETYEDIDYAEDEEEPKSGFDLSRLTSLLPNVDIKALLQNRVLQISAAAVLIIAVIVAGSIWLSFVTAKRPKIADVSNNAYFQGIEMLSSHITEEYRSEMVDTYIVNTSYANTAFAEQMDAINALTPAEPLANDELFINTLTNIQNAIAEAVKADANAELNGTAAERAANSERDWQAIQSAITTLSEAVNPGELPVIIGNLESIVAPTPSPSPTPAGPLYETLKNGMMDSTPVMQMQNRLINLGFLDGDADGDFGNGTEAAVKAFQRAAGLPDDGIATAAVQEAMYAEDAPRLNRAPESTDAPEEGGETGEGGTEEGEDEPVG